MVRERSASLWELIVVYLCLHVVVVVYIRNLMFQGKTPILSKSLSLDLVFYFILLLLLTRNYYILRIEQ